MADAALSLREAAEELGVHYMTAYRYVRLGLLDAAKVGSTWSVQRSAVEAFQSGSERSPVAAGQRAPWSERLESRLVDGDGSGAAAVIDKALASGMGLEQVYLGVLAPAMVHIGERWRAGELDIAIEHRASGIVMRLIGQIGPRFVRRGRTRGLIFVAAPAGEEHLLPLAMLSDLLRLEGWEVQDLGVNLPPESLVSLIEEASDTVAIGLSATAPESLSSLQAMCAAVGAAAPGLFLVVGGGAIQGGDHARALGAHEYAAGGREMSEMIEAHLAVVRAGG